MDNVFLGQLPFLCIYRASIHDVVQARLAIAANLRCTLSWKGDIINYEIQQDIVI